MDFWLEEPETKLEEPETKLEEPETTLKNSRKKRKKKIISAQTCAICLDDTTRENSYILHRTRRITHLLCYGCLEQFILHTMRKKILIESSDVVAKCPGHFNQENRNRCTHSLSLLRVIQDLVPLKPFNLDSILEMGVRIQLNDPSNFRCLNPKCNEIIMGLEKNSSQIQCPYCKRSFCMKCKNYPYHTNYTCNEYKLIRVDKHELSDMIIAKAFKICPKCGYGIEKHSGCNKMTCIKCTTKWCWLCYETDITYSHFNSNHELFYVPPEV